MSLPDNASDVLSESAIKNINDWLTQPKYSDYKVELDAMIAGEQWQQLEDSFFKIVEFGTAGRRGTTGIGSNRINRVTIGESAQALCEYALDADEQAPEKGVVIAYDTRLSSPELSRFAAQVCAANGFKTYIFDSFRSTPELSFAVRYLGAAAGIVISASHNPPADNGFKAYWSDGAQITSPHDKGVLQKAAALTEIKVTDYDQAVDDGVIVVVGEDVDKAYITAVVDQAEGTSRDVAIVYSPLHGAGQTNVLPALQAAGFKNITTVKDQMVPDGNFPTVPNNKPNPQERAANDRAVAQLLAENADIAITNDPDADRIGVMVRTGGEAVYLNGNQSFALAADFALSKLKQKGVLSSKHYLVKTIVTTDLAEALAAHYGATCYGNLLVGFKYVGKLIGEKEDTDEVFVMGGEESYGLLKGTYARDKDGATGALPMAEYAAELKEQGKTLYDRLLELYALHGLYIDRLDNIDSPGADGFERMRSVMQKLRAGPPRQLGDYTVSAVLDYKDLKRHDFESGESSDIDCINGDVVVLEFGDKRRRVTVRPSGTEPKIKLYVQWYSEAESKELPAIDAQYQVTERELEGLSRQLEGWLFE
jgi:phosphoglucomutase